MELKGPTPPPERSLKPWIFAVALFNGCALLVMMAFQTQPALREFQPSTIVARVSHSLGLDGIAQFVVPKPAPWSGWIEILQVADFFDETRAPGRVARFHTYVLLPNAKAGYRNAKWVDAVFSRIPKPQLQAPAYTAAGAADEQEGAAPALPADARATGAAAGDLSSTPLLYYLPTADRRQTLAGLWRHLTKSDAATDAATDAAADAVADAPTPAATGPEGGALGLVREAYDFDLAQRWLGRYCSAGGADCATTGFSGPFLAVKTRPGGAGDETFLLIDLTPVREHAFPLVAAALREAADRAQAAPAQERIAAFRASLANTDIPASDWLEFRSGDLAQTTRLIGPAVQQDVQ